MNFDRFLENCFYSRINFLSKIILKYIFKKKHKFSQKYKIKFHYFDSFVTQIDLQLTYSYRLRHTQTQKEKI